MIAGLHILSSAHSQRTQPSKKTILWLLSFCSLFALSLGTSLTQASPLPNTTEQKTLPNTLKNIQNKWTSSWLAQTHKHVHMGIKLVYAHRQDKDKIDPSLHKDLPSLEMYGFNVYELLKKLKHVINYGQALIVPISQKYQLQLSPQHYTTQNKKIAIQVTFLRKSKKRNQKNKRFNAYASALIRLQNGGKVAFVGPSYKYGRVLIIVSAHH